MNSEQRTGRIDVAAALRARRQGHKHPLDSTGKDAS
jgi:hypothetical protein